MRLAPLLAAAVLAAGCATAGCTVEVAGTPSATPGALLPPRPKEVRLDGVDPCTLLTADQRATLGLTSTPRNTTIAASALYRGDVPICTLTGSGPRPSVVGVGVVTTVGIDVWTANGLDASIAPTTVEGFPAVTSVPQRFTDYCSVDVDVAHGQLLDVQFGDAGNSTPTAQQDLCRRAHQVAEAVMVSLLGR